MPLLFMDGCGEYYDASKITQVWSSSSQNPTIISSTRPGGNAIRLGTLAHVGKLLETLPQNIICGGAFDISSFGQVELFNVRRLGLSHIRLQLESNGSLSVIYPGGSKQTNPSQLALNAYQYIELKVIIDNAIGSFEVRVDNTTVLTDSGLDTLNGTANVDQVLFGDSGSHVTIDLDDAYILDPDGEAAPYDTFLGDIEIVKEFPDAVGNSAQFDNTFPTGPGDHWSKVDDATPNNDTDYNEATVANQIDLFNFPNIAPITGGSTLLAVKLSAYTKKTDAGLRKMRLVSRPLATNRVSPDKVLGTDYAYQSHLMPLNPEGDVAWTDATFNASEFGVESL